MKIRDGYVSNSSSSSFIIAIAKVTDLTKFSKKFFTDKQSHNGIDCILLPTFTVLETRDNNWTYEFKDNKIVVESFNDTSVEMEVTPDSEAKNHYFIANITNDEGDHCFLDKFDDLDYDIDKDFFYGWQRKLLDEMTPENGVEKAEIRFGAGRNG